MKLPLPLNRRGHRTAGADRVEGVPRRLAVAGSAIGEWSAALVQSVRASAGPLVRLMGRLLTLLRLRKPQPVWAADAPNPLQLPIHPSESAAVDCPPSVRTSLATLLTRHILRDGELVLLILKPSMWYIVLISLPFIAAVLIAGISLVLIDDRHTRSYIEAATLIIAGRLMFATLQWIGQLYLLTELRILRISGVFSVDIFDCPLRKVGKVRLASSVRERLLALGSIEILPVDEACPPGWWVSIRRPRQVHEKIMATINRAKHCSFGADAA